MAHRSMWWSHTTDKVCTHYDAVTFLARLTSAKEETPLDRELQAKELARIMSDVYPEPVIFLGYVVTKPHAARRKSTLEHVRGMH